uniref:Uncharacterized protein n=1 Tax=Anopheles culicifacies TaxID=139723 RepID=A0A182LYQ6_9DIPT
MSHGPSAHTIGNRVAVWVGGILFLTNRCYLPVLFRDVLKGPQRKGVDSATHLSESTGSCGDVLDKLHICACVELGCATPVYMMDVERLKSFQQKQGNCCEERAGR